MTSTASSLNLTAAHDFFEPVRLWQGNLSPELTDALADAPPVNASPDSVFTSSENGLVTCILAEQQVDAATQKILNAQKQNLIDLTGVASAYVRGQAAEQSNPDLVYDTDLWQDTYNHLPLMGPSEATKESFNQTMKGIEVASSFIELLLGFAVAEGPALAAFSTFLGGLGDSIRLGVKSTGQSYSTAAIGIVLETQEVGSEIQVQPWLKAYFIDFTQQETNVYSNCASYDSFSMTFEYRVCQSLFNYGALADADVSKEFRSFVKGTQLDDISKSKTFFGGNFAKKS